MCISAKTSLYRVAVLLGIFTVQTKRLDEGHGYRSGDSWATNSVNAVDA